MDLQTGRRFYLNMQLMLHNLFLKQKSNVRLCLCVPCHSYCQVALVMGCLAASTKKIKTCKLVKLTKMISTIQ